MSYMGASRRGKNICSVTTLCACGARQDPASTPCVINGPNAKLTRSATRRREVVRGEINAVAFHQRFALLELGAILWNLRTSRKLFTRSCPTDVHLFVTMSFIGVVYHVCLDGARGASATLFIMNFCTDVCCIPQDTPLCDCGEI